MSKVVKGVGRAVSSVVKGASKVLVPIYGLSKSKTGRKILKVAAIAAAVYFGGAALMGGMSTIGTSTSFLSGMSSGLSSAATGIGQAFTALTSGNLSGAGTALAEGFTGSGAAGFTATTPTGLNIVAADAAPMAVQAATPAAASAATGATTSTGLNLLGSDVAAKSTGMIGKMMASPYTAPALISGSTQLIGGAMQGYGMQKQQEQQQKLEADARARYNTNVGTRLFG